MTKSKLYRCIKTNNVICCDDQYTNKVITIYEGDIVIFFNITSVKTKSDCIESFEALDSNLTVIRNSYRSSYGHNINSFWEKLHE